MILDVFPEPRRDAGFTSADDRASYFCTRRRDFGALRLGADGAKDGLRLCEGAAAGRVAGGGRCGSAMGCLLLSVA